MRISILPKTPLGRWSASLGVASILIIVLIILYSESNYSMALAVAFTIVSVGISGAAFVTGLISMIKNSERSVLVFVGMLIGLWGVLIWGWSWLI
jgi:hypothetical protein